jgi:hypothetical protein
VHTTPSGDGKLAAGSYEKPDQVPCYFRVTQALEEKGSDDFDYDGLLDLGIDVLIGGDHEQDNAWEHVLEMIKAWQHLRDV